MHIESRIVSGILTIKTIVNGQSRVVGRWRRIGPRWRLVARPSFLRRAIAWILADPMSV